MVKRSRVVATADTASRSVGRPRAFDDADERELLIDAAYAALRDQGQDFTIAAILAEAGVSTRSFYRQFDSKDALLCAMYERDSLWAAARLEKRVASASTAAEAVEVWVDEILGLTRHARRAERVSVFRSLEAARAEGIEDEMRRSRERLIAPLRSAVRLGVADGTFTTTDPDGDAALVAAATLHAAGLSGPGTFVRWEQAAVTAFCLRSLGMNANPASGRSRKSG